MDGLLGASFIGFLIGLAVMWWIIRSATRADDVVSRLDGISKRLDVLVRLIDERLGEGGQ